MPNLIIGNTVIPYTVRHSPRARRKRIVVTTNGVEVVVPDTTAADDAEVAAFVHGKRRWIFDTVRALAPQPAADLQQYYGSGAKLQYRGRWLTLDVRPADIPTASVECRSRFHIRLPAGLPEMERLDATRVALHAWMRDRAGRDARRWADTYGERLGVQPAAIRLAEQQHLWGSCGRDRVVRINWRLIQAPAAAMEYVVAHELTHLLERHHDDVFWRTLGRVMPDWPERKQLLDRWERAEMLGGRRV